MSKIHTFSAVNALPVRMYVNNAKNTITLDEVKKRDILTAL